MVVVGRGSLHVRRRRNLGPSSHSCSVRGAALGSGTRSPVLTAPVNDFAKVIDAQSACDMDRMIRTLQTATGDIVVVATVPTIEPYGDIKEYAVKLFANNGKGIGQKGKNNGLLILLALKERRVWVEVGYDLEQWVTDGFAGETSRDVMTPFFRNGQYGQGLRAGTERIIGRIAQGRGVTLDGVRVPRQMLAAARLVDSGLAPDRHFHRHIDRQPSRRRRRTAQPVLGWRRLVERRRAVRRRVRRRIRRLRRRRWWRWRVRRRLWRIRGRQQRRRWRRLQLVEC